MCGVKEVKPYANELLSYCGEKYGFDTPPKLFFSEDEENAKNPLGRTAHYNPANKSITVFVSGRHVKDVLRSIAHELVHHVQNLRGDLSPKKCGDMSSTYAQDNPHMRSMEKEAYLVGNITFRDWENTRDTKHHINIKENKLMNKKTKEKIKSLIKKIISEKISYKRDDKDKEYLDDMEPHIPQDDESRYDQYDNLKYGRDYDYDVDKRDRDKGIFKKGCLEEDNEETLEENEEETEVVTEDWNAPAGASRRLSSSGASSDKAYAGDRAHEREKPVQSSGHGTHSSAKISPAIERACEREVGASGGFDYRECLKTKTSSLYSEDIGAEGDFIGENEEATTVSDGGLSHYSKHSGYNVVTPEQESTIYEARFAKRDNRLFEKLLKKWAK